DATPPGRGDLERGTAGPRKPFETGAEIGGIDDDFFVTEGIPLIHVLEDEGVFRQRVVAQVVELTNVWGESRAVDAVRVLLIVAEGAVDVVGQERHRPKRLIGAGKQRIERRDRKTNHWREGAFHC